jgi:hypothetical protein
MSVRKGDFALCQHSCSLVAESTLMSHRSVRIGCAWSGIARLVILAFVCFFPPAGSGAAAPQQVWFAPLDWFARPEVGYGGATDYMELFRPGPGQTLLSRIAVIKLYPQFIQQATDEDLRTIFAALKSANTSLAMEAGVLDENERCGHGVEGYGGQDAIKLAARIKQLGGELAYVAMDEPAFYGRMFSARGACHDEFADLARNAAKNLAAIEEIFPRVQVGDGEPVGGTVDAAAIQEYARWADAFRGATGKPLAFFHGDVQWRETWHTALEEFVAVMRDRKIPLGIIYNGNDDDTSDEAWIAHAEEHYRAVESDSRIVPDQVVFQSWRPHPSHLFPETDPGSFTYLLKRYLLRPR